MTAYGFALINPPDSADCSGFAAEGGLSRNPGLGPFPGCSRRDALAFLLSNDRFKLRANLERI